jgi:hypothetical protein
MGRKKERIDQDVLRALLSNAMVGLQWGELSEGGVACQ